LPARSKLETYLASAAITDEHKLEGGDLLGSALSHGCDVDVIGDQEVNKEWGMSLYPGQQIRL